MTDEQRAATLRFDKDVYECACVLAKSDPLSLNEWHFDQLAIISKRRETDAREAQRQAQLAIVTAHRVTSAPLFTKAAPAALKDWVNKDGTRTVSYKKLDIVVDQIFKVLREVLDKEAALEQANRELSTRVLELEAQAAARTETHAGR
jgi:hypothetical protein